MKTVIMKNLGKYLLPAAAGGLMCCATSAFGSLTLANTGTGNVGPGLDSNPDAIGGGSPITSVTGQNYSFDSGNDAGTVSSYVYAAGVDSQNTLGGLTFVYVISMNANPSALLGEFEINGNFGSQVMLGYGSGSTFAPSTGSLSLSSIINYSWSSAVGGGTFYVVVGTSATSYTDGTATVQDGGASGNLTVLTPGTMPVPVPEASTVVAGVLMLLPLGIGALRACRKERTL
jgi:hypothetical protein